MTYLDVRAYVADVFGGNPKTYHSTGTQSVPVSTISTTAETSSSVCGNVPKATSESQTDPHRHQHQRPRHQGNSPL